MYIAHIYWLMIVNYYLVSMSKSVGYCQSFNSIRSQICNCQYHFHWASSDQLSSAQLNRPNVGCTRAHALEWTSTWLLFAQSIAEFHWFWLIGRRIGTVLYSFDQILFFSLFFFSHSRSIWLRKSWEISCWWIEIFFILLHAIMKWYIQAPWRIWSIQKNFVDVWVWKKRARTHTIRDVVWSNVMLRMYHSFFVVSIPFQAIAYLYVFQMKVDIFRSAIGGAAVGFNLTWSVAAVFFSPSYFSDHFCWCLFFKTNHIHNIDAKITKFRSFGSHFSFIFFLLSSLVWTVRGLV